MTDKKLTIEEAMQQIFEVIGLKIEAWKEEMPQMLSILRRIESPDTKAVEEIMEYTKDCISDIDDSQAMIKPALDIKSIKGCFKYIQSICLEHRGQPQPPESEE